MRSDPTSSSQKAWMSAFCTLFGIAIAAGNAGCQGQDTLDGHTCPSSATSTSVTTDDDAGSASPIDPNAITYDTFARGFFDGWCQSCHAANVTDRNGAPDDIFFDTRDDIWRLRTQIYAQAAGDNASMPIGPHGPSDAERQKLADWLSCGAP